MKRIGWAIAATMFLTACGQIEVDACEDFIKSGLQSPATYDRAELRIYDDEAMPREQFWQEAGLPDPAKSDDAIGINAQLEGEALGRRTVVIEYDADNAMGVPIRSMEICRFKLVEGKLETKERLQSYVSSAETRRDTAALQDAGLLRDLPAEPKPRPGYACCFTWQ